MAQKEPFILRHAKSSWEEQDKEDIDRPLITRGVNDAIYIAKKNKKLLSGLDLIISSPANRAIHTAIIFSRIVEIPFSKLQINVSVYESSESNLMKIVKTLPDNLNNVMLVGHNPTLTYFANNFLNKTIDNIPTTGLLGLTFDISYWHEIYQNRLKSSFFDYPKKE